MNEELKLKEVYDSSMYFPYKVLDIFNDFFGEDKVDLQGFPSFKDLIAELKNNTLGHFFLNKAAIFNTSTFSTLPVETKREVEKILDDGALDKPVLDNAIMFPIVVSALFNKGYILVHFPHVRITNEYDKGIDINHLWVKVGINLNGTSIGTFSMNRSEYPASHIYANYLHSHVSGIPFEDFTQFKSPCLGKGPIRNTLATLAIGYDEDIWKLFCLELSKYVETESISGGPYKHLEQIGKPGMSADTSTFRIARPYTCNSRFPEDYMRDFIKYLIEQKKFKFNFINGSYSFAMSYTDFMIFISNEFIKWYNLRHKEGITELNYEQLIILNIIKECVIKNGKIYYLTDKHVAKKEDYATFEGEEICTFKGKPITLHITDSDTEVTNTTVLINKEIAATIAKAVLEIINYKYGRKEVKTSASARYI